MRFIYSVTGNSLMIAPSRYRDEDGHRQEECGWLDTTAMKKMHASQALFAIPRGFKPTKSYKDIAVETVKHDASAEFILKDLSKHPEALFNSR
jgi:hypothetical protein